MITLKLNEYRTIGDILWEKYESINFGMNQYGYKGFRDYIEKTHPEIKTSGSVVKGIDLHFENESEATMFILRWS